MRQIPSWTSSSGAFITDCSREERPRGAGSGTGGPKFTVRRFQTFKTTPMLSHSSRTTREHHFCLFLQGGSP